MAPGNRALEMLDQIQAGLIAAAPPPPPPKGGLGGGWRLHQGKRRPHQPAEVILGVGAPEKRAPLYQPPAEQRGGPSTKIEAIVEQRQARRNPPGAPPPERRPENNFLLQFDYAQPAPRSVPAAGGYSSFLDRKPTSFLDEIDEMHASMQSSPRGLTTHFLNRVGGAGSRIDYSALRAELQQKGQAPVRRERLGDLSPRYFQAAGAHR